MHTDRITQLTNQRLAENRDQAARNLVRANAKLADEVRYLRAIVNGQDPDYPCKGCLNWHDLGNHARYCDDASTPEPWYCAASAGGEPGCPNHSARRRHNPIKPGIALLLIHFKDGICHIDESLANGSITQDGAHHLKNKLAHIYADIIVRKIEEKQNAQQ